VLVTPKHYQQPLAPSNKFKRRFQFWCAGGEPGAGDAEALPHPRAALRDVLYRRPPARGLSPGNRIPDLAWRWSQFVLLGFRTGRCVPGILQVGSLRNVIC
jgi:hypothetical protein